MSLKRLLEKIEKREASIGVIGLGYVGLPVACVFAEAGFHVTGIDLKADRVSVINKGRSPIEGHEPGLAELLSRVVADGRFRASVDYRDLSAADIVLIDVETPVGSDHTPQYVTLQAACRSLGTVLSAGALVIVESTTAPGTTERVVQPILEEVMGRLVNEGFYLGACPERVMPGKLLGNLRTMSRVCGGSTPETAEVMIALYRHIVDAELDSTDLVTAELVKTVENSYRDVQIAFANEVALICEVAGADVWQVRRLVNKSPGRQMHLPGAGVGGHCIPKDPWLLAHGAQGRVPLRLIPAARKVNDQMPLHVAQLLMSALAENNVPLKEARIAILGFAYLENSDDTRNSPSEKLVARLTETGMRIAIHDPWVPGYQGNWLELVRGCDAIVVMVAHREYRDLDLALAKAALRTPILIDGRHVVDATAAKVVGLIYRGIGQSVRD
jgi:UDP-N-acetyl-D-mannosaminuronic acid dehydrogenase